MHKRAAVIGSGLFGLYATWALLSAFVPLFLQQYIASLTLIGLLVDTPVSIGVVQLGTGTFWTLVLVNALIMAQEFAEPGQVGLLAGLCGSGRVGIGHPSACTGAAATTRRKHTIGASGR